MRSQLQTNEIPKKHNKNNDNKNKTYVLAGVSLSFVQLTPGCPNCKE